MNRLAVPLVFSLGICFLAASVNGQDGKKPNDADITKQLVGAWSLDKDVTAGGIKVNTKLIFQYKKDGTFKVEITTVVDKVSSKDTFAGKWKVADGTIQTTLTEVNSPANPRLKVGDKGNIRVIAISDTMLKQQDLKDDGTPLGKEIILQRVKDK